MHRLDFITSNNCILKFSYFKRLFYAITFVGFFSTNSEGLIFVLKDIMTVSDMVYWTKNKCQQHSIFNNFFYILQVMRIIQL